MKEIGTDKKGLSDVVTTVLIILLVIVAIGAIWAFVKKPIDTTTQRVNAESLCLENQIEPIGCQKGSDNALSVVYRYTRGNTALYSSITGVQAQVQGASGAVSIQSNDNPEIGSSKTILQSYADTPQNLFLITTYETGAGKTQTCRSVSISCQVISIPANASFRTGGSNSPVIPPPNPNNPPSSGAPGNPGVSINVASSNGFIGPTTLTLTSAITSNGATINAVEFRNAASSQPLTRLTSSPYTYQWNNVHVGTYTISVKADYTYNGQTTSIINSTVVTIRQAPAGSVVVTSPADVSSYTIGQSIPLSVSITGISPLTLDKVSYFVDRINVLNGTTYPSYPQTWRPSVAGNYHISAKVHNKSNTIVAQSYPVSVSVASTNPQIIDVYACGTLDREGATYVLTGDIGADINYGACLTVSADKITIKGNNHYLQCGGLGSQTGTLPGVLIGNGTRTVRNIKVENLRVYSFGTGIRLLGVEESTFYNVTVNNNNINGFEVIDSHFNLILNSTTQNNGQYGIYIPFDSVFNTIRGQRIGGNGLGDYYDSDQLDDGQTTNDNDI